MRFRFEILRRFSVDLPQDLVLRADFAALTDAVHAPDAAGGDHPPVPAASSEPTAPATSEQERLWLLHERHPEDGAYDVPLAFRVRGTVHLPALRRALRALVERHAALRTRLVPTPQGLLQEVDAPYDPWQPCEAGDGEPREAAADRFFAHRFDLRAARMLRATWLPSGDRNPGRTPGDAGRDGDIRHDDLRDGPDPQDDDGGLLLLHLHHVAVDGWSLGILFRDLTDAYTAELEGREAAVPQSPATTPWTSPTGSGPGTRAPPTSGTAYVCAPTTSGPAPPRPARRRPTPPRGPRPGCCAPHWTWSGAVHWTGSPRSADRPGFSFCCPRSPGACTA